MPVERPTFSESWYRVADLRPTLRFTVQVSRQHFRGRMWHVLQDPASNQFFRLNGPAYRFVAMLDGRRTVAQVWRACNEQLGDEAPTQGEAIQLLGQLYASNLLRAELPPDAEGLLRRYRKRRAREVQGYVTSLLFIRIPLIDPDAFLERWVGLLGRAFSAWGLALWVLLLAVGVYSVVGRTDELAESLGRGRGVFDPANLPLLYAALVMAKVLHEFGHAFACKALGRRAGSGGEVHVMGVMFLVFMPLPYVDASSAWALRRKWHRVVVGTGGMMVELALASVAAVVWASTGSSTGPGATLHGISFNVMLIASVSTLLFNGNPLLRYDGYFILSDLLEIPNLAQRSREYIYYLVKRYAWGVRNPRSPAHTRAERVWFALYGPASTVYRVLIFGMILLFLTDRLPRPLAVVAVVFGLVAVVVWLCVPLGKLLRYLASSGELARVRHRAVLTTAALFLAVIGVLGTVNVPDHFRIEGVVEPMQMAFVYAAEDGFVERFMPSGHRAAPDGRPLMVCRSPELSAGLEQLLADRRRLVVRRRIAQTREPAAAQVIGEQLAAMDQQILRARKRLAALVLRAPLPGTWVAPDIERLTGAFVRRGDRIGLVADEEKLLIRAAAAQEVSAVLFDETVQGVEIRIRRRPSPLMTGKKVLRILPAGKVQLPSAALGYAVGGSLQTAEGDSAGTKAAEPFFEVHVTPHAGSAALLRSGQRVVVRIRVSSKPLWRQWWRSLRQVLQRRYSI